MEVIGSVCVECLGSPHLNQNHLFHSGCLYKQYHLRCPRACVTLFGDVLVPVRPPPLGFQHRTTFSFIICPRLHSCPKYPNCTFAHSDAELYAWNVILSRGRDQERATISRSTNSFPCAWNYENRVTRPPPLEDVTLPITFETYRRKYIALLHFEELEHMRILREKCSGYYRVEVCRQRSDTHSTKVLVRAMTVGQVLYAAQASRYADIHGESGTVYRGDISRTAESELFVELNNQTIYRFDEHLTYFVEFHVNHKYFDDLHCSVQSISDAALKKIVPRGIEFNAKMSTICIPQSKYDFHSLDDAQSNGLKIILCCQPNVPVLLPSPFGTGKTRLLSAATEALISIRKSQNQKAFIMICYHHQSSADVLMQDHFEKMLYHKKYPWNVDLVRVTSEVHLNCIKSSRHNMLVREFTEKVQLYLRKEYLVVLTTFNGALKISRSVPNSFFTHILIDEGAQSREPECIGTLAAVGENTRVVIFGDIQQVGPETLVLGDVASKNGLQISLLERLKTQYESFGGSYLRQIVTLHRVYRCHPELLDMSSSLFYCSSLTPSTKQYKGADYPFVFVCSDAAKVGCPSLSTNNYEAEVLISEIMECLPLGYAPGDVCVIATNLSQVKYLRKLVAKQNVLRGVNVITSYEMQGQEFRLLFLSTVECVDDSGKPFDILKSCCNPRVFNTIITRAQSLVVAVGNPFRLLQSERHMEPPRWCWREFISRCLKKKSFFIMEKLNASGITETLQELIKSDIPIVGVHKFKQDHDDASKRDELIEVETETSDDFKHKHHICNHNLLKLTLNKHNYRSKFHQLLCREEEEHARILQERCDGKYYLNVFSPEIKFESFKSRLIQEIQFGMLYSNSLDGDVVSYAKQASEGRLVIEFQNSSKIVCTIFDISHHSQEKNHDLFHKADYLVVHFDSVKFPELQGRDKRVCEVNVKFILKYSYFDRLHAAIDKLSDKVIAKITPQHLEDFTSEEYSGKSHFKTSIPQAMNIDKNQQFALSAVMSCESRKAPIVIVGSFGTGKTRLLACAAVKILQQQNTRVLLCAHHNASVDSFIENYFGPMYADICLKGGIVRLTFPNYRNLKSAFPSFYKTAKEIRNIVSSMKLVVTTLSTSLHLLSVVQEGFFTHILIDEGAQTREPECIAPLCFAVENTKVVIAGDHKQVGPAILVLGDEARENGLKVSLLERLHHTYCTDALYPTAQRHCATLITNYRAHHALLSLPSYLFYNSTLVTAADAVHQLHPDASYPLHFICSDFNAVQSVVKQSQSAIEVDILLNEVHKYTTKWPEEWREKDLSTIGIVATTPTQKSLLIRKSRKGLPECEVLTVYDLQGREFQAIFLSTVEPTFEDGRSKNPTKSPCGQHVFNTALTRAKSLVVCVGNPFMLLRIEKYMENESTCWRDYIRRCMIARTFHIDPAVSVGEDNLRMNLELLRHQIFPRNEVEDVSPGNSLDQRDSIVAHLTNAVQKLTPYRNSKLQVEEVNSEMRWNIVTSSKSQSKVKGKSNETKGCLDAELLVKTPRLALARPLDTSKPEIAINGAFHRRGAFNNDIVKVKVLKSSSSKQHGQVIDVKEIRHSQRYVCKSDQRNVINFYPIDQTVPAIVNLPRLSKRMLQYGLEAVQESQQGYITVFEEASVIFQNDDNLPCIRELIPLDLGPSLLFVVRVIGWAPKYHKPLGAVVEVIPRTNNPFFMEKLLRIVYGVDYSEENVPIPTQPMDTGLDGPPMFDHAFTIDPPDAQNLDDALQLTEVEAGKFKLSVLITDLAKHIPEGSSLDKIARQRAVSVYMQHNHVLHMLPSSFTDTVSLSPGKVRDVIAVNAIVNVSKDSQILNIDSIPLPECGKARSHLKLSYSHAQMIIDGKTVNDPSLGHCIAQFDSSDDNLSLVHTLRLLLKISMILRTQRLGDGAFCNDSSDVQSDADWRSHLIVEELMIWANTLIAEFLSKELPTQSVVRRQLPPLIEHIQKAEADYRDVISSSLSLQCYFSRHLNPLYSPSTSPSSVIIPASLLKQIFDANRKNNTAVVFHLLSNNCYFPQLAEIESTLKFLSRASEYVCLNKHIEGNVLTFDEFSHHGLNVTRYTHFTSPIRRYIDLVVQRLVTSLITKSDVVYTSKMLTDICKHSSRKVRQAYQCETAVKRFLMASKLESSARITEAFIIPLESGSPRFGLTFPSNEFNGILQLSGVRFDISQLNCSNRSLEWHIVSASLTGSHHLFNCPEIGEYTEKKQMSTATSLSTKVFLPIENENCDNRRIQKYYANVIPNCISVSHDVWESAHTFLKTGNKTFLQHLIQHLPKSPALKINKIDDLERLNQSPVVICDMKREKLSGEVVKVWIGSSVSQPIPSPGLQLIEIGPLLKICILHNQNPAQCFADKRLLQASKDRYHSPEEYMELWSKVLLAEAAAEGIKTKSVNLLTDVQLHWPTLSTADDCLDTIHYVLDGEFVSFVVPLEKQEILSFIDISVGSLVCARYQIKSEASETLCAVYHFVIHEVVWENNPHRRNRENCENCIVRMKVVGSQSCRVSKEMKDVLSHRSSLCELQIINLPESFGRVYERLNNWLLLSKLAKNVALGTVSHKENVSTKAASLNVIKNDNLSLTLWNDSKTARLNPTQEKAIKLAVSRNFQLIQGPPGTGKSITGTHLAYIFARANKIQYKPGQPFCCVLYCGPTNKSVDVVHEKFRKLNKTLNPNRKLKILRVYGRTHERRDFPDPFCVVQSSAAFDASSEGRCLPEFREDALHHKIRIRNVEIKMMEERYLTQIKQNRIPSYAYKKRYLKLIKKEEEKVLQELFDVLLCTCNETCSRRMLKLSEKKRIAQCVVDECGMATEPETLAAISLSEHAVLIGDHMQLQPIIKYHTAKECGLNRSMFERYAEKLQQTARLVTLEIQYRMHPSICKGPSELFYGGILRTDNSILSRPQLTPELAKFWPEGPHCPVMFCDIVGDESYSDYSEADTHSKCNEREAAKIVKIIEALRHHKVKTSDIAVLTPYTAQKNLIKSKMQNWGEKKNVRVASITESQGDEYNVIVFSTVRSKPLDEISDRNYVQPDHRWMRENLGFLTDYHQINVGITRAKYGLIIVGNCKLLKYNAAWKELIEHHCCVKDAKSFP